MTTKRKKRTASVEGKENSPNEKSTSQSNIGATSYQSPILESSNINLSVIDMPFVLGEKLDKQKEISTNLYYDSFSNISPFQGSCVSDPSGKRNKSNIQNLYCTPQMSKGCVLRDITNDRSTFLRYQCANQGVQIQANRVLSKTSTYVNYVETVRNLDFEFTRVQEPGTSYQANMTPVANSQSLLNQGGIFLDANQKASANSHLPMVKTTAICKNKKIQTQLPVLNESIAEVNNPYPGYEDIGDPHFMCSHCHAKFWYDERMEKAKSKKHQPIFNLCCTHGKIKLPPMLEPPEIFKNLIYGKSTRSKKFQNGIRMYNMIFAFTSMGGKLDRSFNTGRSAPIYRLNGENFHLMGSLLPTRSPQAQFAQLYIFDTENEIRNIINSVRSDCNDYELNQSDFIHEDIVSTLKKILDENNILVQAFRYAGKILTAEDAPDVKLRLISRRNQDGRVHNLPQASEVAVLIVGDVENLENHRDIIVERQSGKLQRISELHTSYLPLQYPLFFVFGEDGYRDNIQHNHTERTKEKGKRNVTMREYFSYRLMERDNESPHILFGRRLFQQFIVDAYTMVESYRIAYLRCHQQDLRCDSYAALGDALNSGESNSSNSGKRIILPSSFVGGARYMIQNYHDAMSICKWIGYPNLFITFTCNPKWPEVQRYLKSRGLTANDRPDILSRIFHSKLDNMLTDIRKKKKFGETSAVIYTIEFQKRGLPHAHILLFLKDLSAMVNAKLVDQIISAEIPNPDDDLEYYDAVKDFMMHGPCGQANLKSPCMNGRNCTKHFPKRYVDSTTIDQDGYVVYRRRDNGSEIIKGGIQLDNRYVVPHNPFLLKKYRAHINVEWCNRSRSIKYLFKYVHKGNDRATAVFYQNQNNNDGKQIIDEIKQYLDCRYISASEAAWRLFGYDIHFKEPNVVRLTFHLPNKQNIVFKESESFSEVLAKAASKETMFTAWMIANNKFEQGKEITYAEYPKKFVWDDQSKSWGLRKRGKALGRLSYIYPGSGELYYMRILLNVVRGCLSYDDIYTYNGIRYQSFKEACYARGLLDDDKEYVDAIIEASFWGAESMIRSLFVNLLTSDCIVRPDFVWNQCKELLTADILTKYRRSLRRPDLTLTDLQIQNLCLREIEDLMHRKGKSLRDYPTLPYPEDIDPAYVQNQLIATELNYDKEILKQDHLNLVEKLNDQQRHAYDSIMKVVRSGKGQVFFLYGYGGTGKTFVWRTLSAALRSVGDIVLNVASSGIASLLLPGGRTAHSRFSIPLNLNENSTCNIVQKSELAQLILKTKMIIWDEAPMMHRNCFEALDRSIRDIMKVDNPEADHLPFGGKVIVFGGDFRQILPVIPKGTRQDIVHATINSSKIWRDCKLLRLTKNMRLENLQEGADILQLRDFSTWMSSVGDGTLGGDNDGEVLIDIPEDLLINQSDDFIGSIVEEIYPDLSNHIGDVDFLNGRAILAPTLNEVEAINDYMVSMHLSDERIYLSSDSIETTDRGVNMFDQMHSVEFLNSINCSGLPNHQLKLKVGVPVMLLRNLDHTAGLCNGTRLVITKLGNYVIEARILGVSNGQDIVYIPRLTLCPSDPRMPFRFQRRQFPLMVSYAMTINKSQGQSLANVGIFLKRPVFTHGQLYVAISRVTNRRGLKNLCADDNGKLTNKTHNVVFKEVFQNL